MTLNEARNLYYKASKDYGFERLNFEYYLSETGHVEARITLDGQPYTGEPAPPDQDMAEWEAWDQLQP